MITCEACGADVPEDAAYCLSCGEPASGPSRPQEGAEKPPRIVAAIAALSPRQALTLVAAVSLSLLLLVLGVSAFMTSGRTVRGAVVSLTSGKPIADASIGSGTARTKTDRAGRFELSKLQLGSRTVTVYAKGFPPFESELDVRPLRTPETRLRLPDASVTVRVDEVARQPEEVADPRVLVGETEASRTARGVYVVKGLPQGPMRIEVSAPHHEPRTTSVTLKAGDNAARVSLGLTAEETYARYFEAYKAGRWPVAYAYLHPDVAKRESLARYQKDQQQWGTPVSTKVLGVRRLERWTSPFTKASYADVAEVRRTIVGERQGARFELTRPQYWVKVGDLWFRVDL